MEIYIEIPEGHGKAEAFGAELQGLLAEDQIESRVLGNAEIYTDDRKSGVAELWKRALLPDGSRRLVIDTDADAEFPNDPAVLDAAKRCGFLTLTIEQRMANHGEPIEAFDYQLEFQDGGKSVTAQVEGYSPGDRLSSFIEMRHTKNTKAYELVKVEDDVLRHLGNLCDITSEVTQQRMMAANAPSN